MDRLIATERRASVLSLECVYKNKFAKREKYFIGHLVIKYLTIGLEFMYKEL